jgi:hypothetical protein
MPSLRPAPIRGRIVNPYGRGGRDVESGRALHGTPRSDGGIAVRARPRLLLLFLAASAAALLLYSTVSGKLELPAKLKCEFFALKT